MRQQQTTEMHQHQTVQKQCKLHQQQWWWHFSLLILLT